MKDSQQMSVDVSSQDDMALKALPPVSLKEANIFRVDSIVADNLDAENYNLNLSDVEDDESGERKQDSVSDSAIPEVSQESEDEILNKFHSPENDESVTNGCQDADENLEDRLLSDLIDGKEENEEAITANGECVNDADLSELSKKSDDIISDVNCVADEEEGREKEDVAEKEIEEGEEKEKQVEDVEKEEVEEAGKEEAEEMDACEEIEKEKEDAEKKEKANAELLKDQIMDTEDLLQIVDQQDTGGTNDNSCSGENTPDKEESETECNDTETDKNEDEDDTQTSSKNDDDTVDIEEDSPYKGDFDSELDKEYEKIVNEKENESLAEESNDKSEKIDEDVCENAQEDKSVTDGEKENFQDSELDDNNMEVSQNEKNDSTNKIETEISDKQTSADPSSKTKRTLSEPDATVEAKRLRLEENDVIAKASPVDDEQSKPSAPIIALNAISEYMQKRTLKRLTREDLEQICLMKMCEAICYKSELGELRHQFSVQEQMVDMWRKEAAQLTKQARDLEIVNKRLLHEVRQRNDKDKPLIPVKITRSVGLQVRSDNNVMCNVMTQKRRFVRPQQPAAPVSSPKPQQNRFNQNKPPASPTNKSPINKTVPQSPPTKTPLPIKPKPANPKTPNSLLSKALQNSTAQAANSSPTATAASNTVTPPLASISNTSTAPATPVTTKSLSNASPKPIKPTESKGVIDLTDEDEKKPSPASTNASTTVNNTTQGVRIVSTPVKNTNTVSSAGVVNPPRIMYLYNNQLHQGVLATDSTKVGSQKVMFKLNSNVIGQANGVLTAVTNGGSPITVTNGTVRSNQVQSVRFSSPVTTVRTTASSKAVAKHPAPLPPPPITQISLAARKPIPPKPHLSIRRSSGGIVLSWKMPYILDNYEAIASYQLYAYQETTSPPSSDMWRKVGDVKALALPMACTLTQFADGNKYHFAVRAVDVQKRMGPFSDPEQILL